MTEFVKNIKIRDIKMDKHARLDSYLLAALTGCLSNTRRLGYLGLDEVIDEAGLAGWKAFKHFDMWHNKIEEEV